ncbi:hypothetical protein BUALT_Bualt08G0090200 [Buddleja alternifolia]|uniref:Uncharacterized protein n=1 Tax=Buddleja alternifolia TaxID=168488 RepID=A0AAV6XFR3_9LAMI|nr:hypothetical protein BUALT_Bualt08G0090200 [Buddleja alternifolia]
MLLIFVHSIIKAKFGLCARFEENEYKEVDFYLWKLKEFNLVVAGQNEVFSLSSLPTTTDDSISTALNLLHSLFSPPFNPSPNDVAAILSQSPILSSVAGFSPSTVTGSSPQSAADDASSFQAVNTTGAILSPMTESIPAAEINAAAGVLLSRSATGAVSSSITAAGNHSAVSLLSPHAGALLSAHFYKIQHPISTYSPNHSPFTFDPTPIITPFYFVPPQSAPLYLLPPHNQHLFTF